MSPTNLSNELKFKGFLAGGTRPVILLAKNPKHPRFARVVHHLHPTFFLTNQTTLLQPAHMENKTYPVHCWDFTLACKEDQTDLRIQNLLKEISNKWAFQLEKGSTGYLHWQGRFRLRDKKRLGTLVNLVKGQVLEGAHFSPTAGVNSKNFNYVMKLDTRQAGPWTDENPIKIIPRELKEVTLRPWQKQIADICKEYDGDRTINVLVDLEGGAGKGLLRKYLRHHDIASIPPEAGKAQDIMAWVCKFQHTAYVFDVPRQIGEKKDSHIQLFKGIESVKDGRGVELRYSPVDVQLAQSPVVWVFTNEYPKKYLLSADRWKIWAIDPEKETLIANASEGCCIAIGEHNRAHKKTKELADSQESKSWEDRRSSTTDVTVHLGDVVPLPPTPPPSGGHGELRSRHEAVKKRQRGPEEEKRSSSLRPRT